ncbi:MAG: endolytic transglycosylase MltG [Bacteroidota bacterium]|nr:endolytic transglycosylase MltG [Bacteroidota bacterium]
MKPKIQKTIRISSSLLAILVIVLVCSFFMHSSLKNKESAHLYIYPGDSKEAVLAKIQQSCHLKSVKRLSIMLDRIGCKEPLPSGHYLLKPGMSDFRLAKILKSGTQTPVRITFNNVRTVDQLAGRLSKQLMADSLSLLNCFRDTSWMGAEGFNEQTYMCIFMPNTYELWWNAKPEKVRSQFIREYHKFWDDSHIAAAKRHKLTPVEAYTLASIVEEETNKGDELSKVAGLYLNRLSIDMPLQADPTIKYIAGDLTMKRIYINDTRKESPYNTYKHTGLPPGPIRITSIRSIEAVLNASRHSYIYMCAKSDFSGYHAFATTLSQHAKNAQAYHKALNERGILE